MFPTSACLLPRRSRLSGNAGFRLRSGRVFALSRLGALVLWAAAVSVAAQSRLSSPGVQSRSHSGQIIVQTVPGTQPPTRLALNLETNRNFIRLDPTLLPVSCERAKQILWRELGVRGPWSGRIFVALYPAASGEDPINLGSARFRDGWQYRIEMPDLIDRTRYVRTLVEVFLLELANRQALERSAEIPLWLVEGFTRQLLLSSEVEIILPPPRPSSSGLILTTTVINARKQNPLALAHQQLSANLPLTFQQLSWPAPAQLEGEAGEVYRSSSQLLVHDLLRLNNGPACMARMLSELPRHLNWQFAFLRGFEGHFHRPLDIEKWWTLHLEHFTGRNLTQTWPAEESWQKFYGLVRSSVQVRSETGDLPLSAEVSLQEVLREWDRVRQDQIVPVKVRELEQLRLRLAPQYATLAEQYYRVLVTYLENRNHSFLPFRKKAAQRHAATEAIQELDRLDVLLLDMRPVTLPPKTK